MEEPYTYFDFSVIGRGSDRIEEMLRRYGVERFICVHPGTSGNFEGKRYRKDRQAVLVRSLMRQHGVRVFLTGTGGEREIAADIIKAVPDKEGIFDLAGQLSIWELIELLRRSLLFVSGDTGPVHLAASLGVNTVVLYGPTSPDKYRPLNENSQIFYKRMACSPCVGVDYINRPCKNGFRCLDFDPQDVLLGISEKFFDAVKR